MGKKLRTPRTAAFKKKVALEALREDKTLRRWYNPKYRLN